MERFLVVHLPTWLLGILMVAASVGIALGGFYLVRRFVDTQKFRDHHDVAGFLIAVVGVIYAVLLAFMVIIQWESFSDADVHAGNEAAAIGSLYRDGVALGHPGLRLRAATDAYAHQIAYREWPYMSNHVHEDPQTDIYLNGMWKAVMELKGSSTNPTQEAFITQAVTDVASVSTARRVRLHDSTSTLPFYLWIVLVFGGVLTIAFCFFFDLDNLRAHAAMIGILAALIGMSLFIIVALDLPYSGGIVSGPESLTEEIHEFCSYNFAHPALEPVGRCP
jgi:hypothetical protein